MDGGAEENCFCGFFGRGKAGGLLWLEAKAPSRIFRWPMIVPLVTIGVTGNYGGPSTQLLFTA